MGFSFVQEIFSIAPLSSPLRVFSAHETSVLHYFFFPLIIDV